MQFLMVTVMLRKPCDPSICGPRTNKSLIFCVRHPGLIDPLEEYGITGAQAFQMFSKSVRQSIVASVFQYYYAGAIDEGYNEEPQLAQSSQDSSSTDLISFESFDGILDPSTNGVSIPPSLIEELNSPSTASNKLSSFDDGRDEITPNATDHSSRKPLTSSKGVRKGLRYGPEPPPEPNQPPSQHSVDTDKSNSSEEIPAVSKDDGPLWG